jgi:hypothetical protein
MSFLAKANIRARVMLQIESRIAEAQKECDQKHLELERIYREEMDVLSRKMFTAKQDAIEAAVQSVIGKIM